MVSTFTKIFRGLKRRVVISFSVRLLLLFLILIIIYNIRYCVVKILPTIEVYNGSYEKTCTHKYLTECKTNPQPPGFADYLRGTITLFNLSQKYGYKLLLDKTHPIFEFIKDNDDFVVVDKSTDVIEMLCPISYDEIYRTLTELFEKDSSFVVMTNSLYISETGELTNWGEISGECRTYLKNTITPSSDVYNKIEDVIRTVYKINNDEKFKSIHIRTGDSFIHNDSVDLSLFEKYYDKIQNIMNQDIKYKYVLISDSSLIAKKLKDNIDGLCYWDNTKFHLGDLKNNEKSSLLDTIVDFFILSRSTEIVSNGSGFSTAVSKIYNIPYVNI